MRHKGKSSLSGSSIALSLAMWVDKIRCHAYHVHCLLFLFFHPHFSSLVQKRNHGFVCPWQHFCFHLFSLQTFSISLLFTIWQKNSFEILFFALFVWTTPTTSTTAHTSASTFNEQNRPKCTWAFHPFDLNFDWPIRRNRYAKSKCGVMDRHTDGVFAIEVSETGTTTTTNKKREMWRGKSAHI